MIILELEIRDFKQYRGTHLFTPPENGVIGIVGPNGAGKTTLFEAIEWCLYQGGPKNDDVPTRGVERPRPLVRLRLASTRTTEIFEVERSMTPGGSVRAEVRRLDGDTWTVLVSSGRAVKTYISQSLIGLEYKAFVATFFTRQKELSFFGSLTGLERRREINRLLGLETIRRAQTKIADDRRTQKGLADGLMAAFHQRSGERDFEAEIAAAEQERAALLTTSDDLSAAVTNAAQALRKATALRDELETKRSDKLALDAQIATQRGNLDRATATMRTADAELAQISTLEQHVVSLTPIAGRSTADVETVRALERDRDAFEKRQQLIRDVSNAEIEITRIETRASDVLRQAGDVVSSQPIADALKAATARIGALDSAALEQQVRDLERVRQLAIERDQAAQKLLRFRERIADLDQEKEQRSAAIATMPSGAELDDRRMEIERQRALSQGTIEDVTKSIALHEAFVDLDVSSAERRCPTCGRPIAEHELNDARNHVESLVRDLRQRIAEHRTSIEAATAELQRLEVSRTERAEAERGLVDVEQRLASGGGHVTNQESTVADLEQQVTVTLARLNRSDTPAAAEVEQAQSDLDAIRRQQALHLQMVELGTSLSGAQATLAASREDLAATVEVAFDPAMLVAAREALEESRRAETRLESMRTQIERRGEWERSRSEAGTAATSAETELAALDQKIAAVGFDPAAFDEAKWDWDAKFQAERRATQNRDEARAVVQRLADRIDRIRQDREAIGDMRASADRARIKVDELDRIYAAFNDFEQYVARKVRPQLEDVTSELVQTITEGKYDGVRLDDDYGITVEDGEHGYFPIASFSGGERDVISLAARLALSRMIGSQAANPPSFLVLDEVFGSLDRERRVGVLELLNTLAGSAEAFQQLFVISHVDDVRLSPAFTEMWRVVEEADGTSRLENLGLTGGAEDL